MRDYAPLFAAAAQIPATFTLAVQQQPLIPLPSNVHAGAVPRDEFLAAMRRSRVVVVPMRAGLARSAGQQTYLNAMAIGKLVVVTDTPGVRDYVEHGVTGLIVPPGDPAALTDALQWALATANESAVRQIAAEGRRVARTRFSPMRHVEALLAVACRAAEDREAAA